MENVFNVGDAVFSRRFGRGFVSEESPNGYILVRFDRPDTQLHGGYGMKYDHLAWEGHFWVYAKNGYDIFDPTLRYALPTDPPSSGIDPDGTITAELRIDENERY